MDVLIINPEKGYLKDFISYLRKNYPKLKFDVINPPPILKKKIYGKLIIILSFFLNSVYFVFNLIRTKKKYKVFILNGILVIIPFLFLARTLPFMQQRKIIAIHFYVHGLGSNKIVKKILKFLLNSARLTLIVQSQYEKKYYSQLTYKATVLYFPYCQGEVSVSGTYGQGKEYIFSGGYTNRDYNCLLKVAENINYNFIVICSRLNRFSVEIPTNVKILKDIEKDAFWGYLKESKIVIVPLKEETGSSRQMVALAAKFFKKPIIYTNINSLSQYFDDGITGISYRKGDFVALKNKIIYLLSNQDISKKNGRRKF